MTRIIPLPTPFIYAAALVVLCLAACTSQTSTGSTSVVDVSPTPAAEAVDHELALPTARSWATPTPPGDTTKATPTPPVVQENGEAPSPAVTSEPSAPPPAPTASALPDLQLDPNADLPRLADVPEGLVPTRIEIPAIGVDAPIIGLNLAGEVPEVPTNFGDVGWYEQTRKPGEIGPSVLAGHIDSVDGPAVFALLDQLAPGDEVVVHGESESVTFIVSGHGEFPKDDLPPEVFGFSGPVPELRLITCGGSFDTATGHYTNNHVVWTVMDPGGYVSSEDAH